MDTIEPGVNPQRTRSCVLTCANEDAAAVSRGNASEQFRVDHVNVWTRGVINAYGVLQLGFCNTVQDQAAVAVVIIGAVTPHQLERQSGLEGYDCSQAPSADEFVHHSVACAEQCLAVAKRQIISTAGVDHMAQIE